ncbi:MAG: hypothetical protein V4714_08035, partial [Bacteroidota bacterium]
ELCFNQKENQHILLKKWNKNIFFHLEGDTLPGDKAILLEIASTINALKLPITVAEATPQNKSNFLIVSGSSKEVKLDWPIIGASEPYCSGDSIDSVRIRMLNTVFHKTRSAIFWHEFIHSLGFSSHITTDLKSIMHRTEDSTHVVSNKDLQAIKILYNVNWPAHYNTADFEKDFSTVLYHIQAKQKFLQFLRTNKIDRSVLKEFLYHDLLQPTNRKEPQIFKTENSLKVAFQGNIPNHLANDLHLIIKEINTATPNFHLEFIRDTPLLYNKHGIVLNFIQENKGNQDNNQTITATTMFVNYINIANEGKFETINRTEVTINYSGNLNLFKRDLGAMLYQIICLKDYKDRIDPFKFDKKGVHLKPKYKELLKVYYAPELPHNFTKHELEEVIQEYK